ncbi:MAG: oligosaccharide flippase family protein [Hyphomicrobium sp.]
MIPVTAMRAPRAPLDRATATQSAWLFGGFGVAQVCAFARNAILAHVLSKGDFGVAATLTLMLQVVETITDLGSDRLIVQAVDGGHRRFMAASHFVLAARGILVGAVLLTIGPSMARFFGAPDAAVAFQLLAITPILKGFVHLDFRRAQRRFDSRPFAALEAAPQAIALTLTVPVLALTPTFEAVAWLSISQAMATAALSHLTARRPYRIAFDAEVVRRHIAFGWPILVSALPLVAVYHGDRAIIGRLQGLEILAGYTAAFLVTMAPGVIAAKVGNALMLPHFSAELRRSGALSDTFRLMTDGVIAFAALYLALFIVAGEPLLSLAFGANYTDLGAVVGWLAAMWALRMVQAAPGMALMAAGETKPMLAAGIIRAHALPFVLLAASFDASLAALAAVGFAFEALSLAYIVVRVERLECGLGAALLARASLLAPIAVLAAAARASNLQDPHGATYAAVLTLSIMLAIAIVAFPALRRRVHYAVISAVSSAGKPLDASTIERKPTTPTSA